MSIAHRVSGRCALLDVMYTACTLMNAEALLEPKGIPFHEVLSWSGGKLSSAEGYGSSAVSFTTTPRV